MIKTKEQVKNMFAAPEDSIKYVDDFGCGFNLSLYETSINEKDILCYFDLLVNGLNYAFSHYDYSYFKEVILGDVFNSVEDQDLIKQHYLKFRKLFGGNHFCEYGKTSDGFYYLLIHCGSDKLFKEVYERTKNFEFSVNISIKFAILNRKEILKNFKESIGIQSVFELDEVHHFVDFKENFLVHNLSAYNEKGNIFSCGPWQTSYHVSIPEGSFLEHGSREYFVPIFSLKSFLNRKKYVNGDSYFKAYKKEKPEGTIIRKLHPICIVRANRDC